VAKVLAIHIADPGRGPITVNAYRRESHVDYTDATRDALANGAGETASEETNRKGSYIAASITKAGGGDLSGPYLLQLFDSGASFMGDVWADFTGAGTAAAPIVAASASVDAWLFANLTFGNSALKNLIDAIPTTIRIKKNTSLANFMFVMLDTAGTPATGKTVTGTVSIDGAAFVSLTNSITEIGSGAYKVDLAAADVNGNVLLFKFSESTCETCFIETVTQP
jgi:hypothetical protein